MVRGTALVAIALFWLSGTALTSDQTTEKNGEKKSLKQFLHVYNYDPGELHGIWQESERRKHLAGPFWLGGYYIPRANSQVPGLRCRSGAAGLEPASGETRSLVGLSAKRA